MRDNYLLSGRKWREDWSAIYFYGLGDVDLVECFERLDLRRQVTKTGIIKLIEPHAAA